MRQFWGAHVSFCHSDRCALLKCLISAITAKLLGGLAAKTTYEIEEQAVFYGKDEVGEGDFSHSFWHRKKFIRRNIA